MQSFKGICGSPGFASGKAVVVAQPNGSAQRYNAPNYPGEEKRFRAAQRQYEKQLAGLRKDALIKSGEQGVEIFKAYRSILRDEAFFSKALTRSKDESVNIEFAIDAECRAVARLFEALDDPYLRERMSDIRNVCEELIRILSGKKGGLSTALRGVENAIIVARDLSPADTVKLDKTRIQGFVTELGGATSHVAILAKVLGIPAVVGVAGVTEIQNGAHLLLDAVGGEIICDPDGAALKKFEKKRGQDFLRKQAYEIRKEESAVTLDGTPVSVLVNTGDAESIAAFVPEYCDGIGLLRTEFLYMGQKESPNEKTQFEAYRRVAKRAGGKEVIIRTLDIGGDKQLPYLELPQEENPSMGLRAIRLCLARPELFLTQLRAILRASVSGNIKVMFPMITTMEELRAAKEYLRQAMFELSRKGVAYNPDISVGIMIETPSAALIADMLARECDFFSIGSNDLIQYTLAADRMNAAVQNPYANCDPAVLRLIASVAEKARNAGIPWGICGEAASDELLIPLWVALAVSKLSVAPSLTSAVKQHIRFCDRRTITPFIKEILNCGTAAEVKERLVQTQI